ncbi:MAG: (Fe-S)-binding protein [Clostridia bacterium]|nr:(Fe-S)-binding protein [Clostridia bacterium]
MIMSQKSKEHIDACRFCWMCHHICPVGNATGQERNTARARALGLSLVNRDTLQVEDVIDNVYECCLCGGCVGVCITGWDPVMFTKEARLQAALEDKLPAYINALVDNCLDTGNAYGVTELDGELQAAVAAHAAPTDTLLVLGVDARCKVPAQAVKAIRVLEKAGVSFTVLANEPATGWQMDFLVGAAEETKQQMAAAAQVMNGYKTVVLYDPNDAKCVKQTYHEYGVETTAKATTFTAFVAALLAEGKLEAARSDRAVVYQDPYQLARDLSETEEPREIIASYAVLGEMLCNRKETIAAGNLLMAEYIPQVMEQVAARRLFNAESVGADTLVTACVGEYAVLKAVPQDKVAVLSIEDLILG